MNNTMRCVTNIYVFLLLFVCILIAISTGYGASVDSEKVPIRVPRVNSHVKLDGVLNDEVWRHAAVMGLEYEIDPGENIPALVKTEMLLCYDENHLYAGFRCYDPNPSQIRARICDRDHLSGDDWVGLNLDTFNDERRSFLFLCNPYGVQSDDIESQAGGGTWDAIWASNGRINNEGYVVEMAIPFSSLSFQRADGDQIWGIDAIRSYPRDVDHRLGLIVRDPNNNCYWCQFDKLIGFDGATPGRNIEIDPTISGFFAQEREHETSGSFIEGDKEVNAGVTASWGFTPNLTLSATVNPDFSQVEADAAQLDINTQFALCYSEKRPFFLEGNEFYQTRVTAVHTRTIADPDWGIKLSGKEGPSAIGFFSAQDNITNLVFPSSQGSDDESLDQKSYGSALRYRHDVGKSTSLGLLITDRESDGYYNRLGSVDGNIRLSLKDRVKVQLLGSSTEYPRDVAEEFDQPMDAFEGYGFDFYYIHDTRSLDWYLIHEQYDPDFRTDLGFKTMVDYRYTDVGVGHTWNRDPGHWWHMLNFGSCYEYEDDFDGNELHKRFAYWFNYAGPIQTFFDVSGGFGKKYYDGVEFDNNTVYVDGAIRPSGVLYFWMGCGYGDKIDYAHTRQGIYLELESEIVCNLGRHLRTEWDYTYERMKVHDGRLYTANIGWVKVIYQFNKRTFLRVITQLVHYDRNTDLYEDEDTSPIQQNVFNQILFSYKINPQTVFYLGYNDNFDGDQDIDLVQTNRTIFAKIGYAWVL